MQELGNKAIMTQSSPRVAEMIQAELDVLDEVCALAQDLDLKTPEGEQQARQLLVEHGLPEFLVYGLQPASLTDEIRQRAAKRVTEMQAGGDVP
jgi:hypothetical protein